jgi:hypothetical protein
MGLKGVLSSLCLSIGLAVASHAEPMRYIYPPPLSASDTRYNYHWELLRAALEKTKGKYGPYVIGHEMIMNERRQMQALASGQITVMVQAASRQFEHEFTPVRIPLDKGLIGYRVFLIDKADQPKFTAVKTLDDLRKFTVGQGAGWQDGQVWRANGFRVVEGESYDGLFGMLLSHRFDFFSRGIVEVIDEYQKRKDKMPQLHIEETICVYYPWPFYFYFPKTEYGRKLAARVQEGLLAVFADKSVFNPLFLKYHGAALKMHDLKYRKLFVLKNPLLSPETPLNDKRLWYDPYLD